MPLRPDDVLLLFTLDGQGHAHTASNAEGRKSPSCAPPLHFMEQRDEDARAGSADRVADGDGSAIHIYLGQVPPITL